jgi:hypothetical protein
VYLIPIFLGSLVFALIAKLIFGALRRNRGTV